MYSHYLDRKAMTKLLSNGLIESAIGRFATTKRDKDDGVAYLYFVEYRQLPVVSQQYHAYQWSDSEAVDSSHLLPPSPHKRINHAISICYISTLFLYVNLLTFRRSYIKNISIIVREKDKTQKKNTEQKMVETLVFQWGQFRIAKCNMHYPPLLNMQ